MAPVRYRIRVRGRLTERLGSAFGGMTLEPAPGQTVLVGEIRDQSHLYGILDRVRGHRVHRPGADRQFGPERAPLPVPAQVIGKTAPQTRWQGRCGAGHDAVAGPAPAGARRGTSCRGRAGFCWRTERPGGPLLRVTVNDQVYALVIGRKVSLDGGDLPERRLVGPEQAAMPTPVEPHVPVRRESLVGASCLQVAVCQQRRVDVALGQVVAGSAGRFRKPGLESPTRRAGGRRARPARAASFGGRQRGRTGPADERTPPRPPRTSDPGNPRGSWRTRQGRDQQIRAPWTQKERRARRRAPRPRGGTRRSAPSCPAPRRAPRAGCRGSCPCRACRGSGGRSGNTSDRRRGMGVQHGHGGFPFVGHLGWQVGAGGARLTAARVCRASRSLETVSFQRKCHRRPFGPV